ncbi:MAG: transglutaminase-like domain-containing protein [Planctomycetota bacterium]|jgi:hypothetical protein
MPRPTPLTIILLTLATSPGVLTAARLSTPPPPARGQVLQRADPRVYDVALEVGTPLNAAASQAPPTVAGGDLLLPVILRSTFSEVDEASLFARLWIGAREDTSLSSRVRLVGGSPDATSMAVIPIQLNGAGRVTCRIGFRTMAWSSLIDEQAAARLTWPRHWPEGVQPCLKPSDFVESDDPFFTNAIAHVTGGQLRDVVPYFAAKDIVRSCIENISVLPNGDDAHGRFGRPRRSEVRGRRSAVDPLRPPAPSGALATARQGHGSAHDLVCVCIAMLRAAGLPARAVLGVEKRAHVIEERDGRVRPIKTETIVSWGEFYLPGAGWIPFDPDAMRSRGLNTRHVREPWPDFGSITRLNQRVTLCHGFVPPSRGPGAGLRWDAQSLAGRPPIGLRSLEIVSHGATTTTPASGR